MQRQALIVWQLTAELQQYQWGSSEKRNDKVQRIPLYIQQCVRFRARYQQCMGDRKQAWVSVRR